MLSSTLLLLGRRAGAAQSITSSQTGIRRMVSGDDCSRVHPDRIDNHLSVIVVMVLMMQMGVMR